MSGKEMEIFIKSQGVELWKIARALKLSDAEFCKRITKPFNDEEVRKIKEIIKLFQKGAVIAY